MTIEVVGAGTQNKGAELLLVAIKQHYASRNGEVRLAVSPWFGSFAERASYGLLQKVESMPWGRSRAGFSLLPPSFRAAYGMVTDSEIDAVLDASGFAFGDQHPVQRTLMFEKDVKRWKEQGKSVVLLPQALGPFENQQIRDGFKRIVEQVDVVYARDQVSLDHARSVVGSTEKLLLAPDITIGVRVDSKAAEEKEKEPFACIVPNSRMMDKMSPEAAAQYIPFLRRCIGVIEQHGITPKLLLHEASEDHQLVAALQREGGRELEVLQEHDPLKLKAILGRAALLIGSRFHALVGALSQATPSIAAGWSHKYEMLLSDFGCPGMVLSPEDETERIEDLVRQCIDDRERVVATLSQARERMVGQLEGMWAQVDRIIGLA